MGREVFTGCLHILYCNKFNMVPQYVKKYVLHVSAILQSRFVEHHCVSNGVVEVYCTKLRGTAVAVYGVNRKPCCY